MTNTTSAKAPILILNRAMQIKMMANEGGREQTNRPGRRIRAPRHPQELEDKALRVDAPTHVSRSAVRSIRRPFHGAALQAQLQTMSAPLRTHPNLPRHRLRAPSFCFFPLAGTSDFRILPALPESRVCDDSHWAEKKPLTNN